MLAVHSRALGVVVHSTPWFAEHVIAQVQTLNILTNIHRGFRGFRLFFMQRAK
jgi:hypothetical protein